MAEEIRADYEELESASKHFKQESDRVQQSLSAIKNAMGTLQQGGWRGSGADSFYSEMNNVVIPAINRLKVALVQAGVLTTQMITTLRQAEEEAKSVFNTSDTAYRL